MRNSTVSGFHERFQKFSICASHQVGSPEKMQHVLDEAGCALATSVTVTLVAATGLHVL